MLSAQHSHKCGKPLGSAKTTYALAVLEYLEKQGHDPANVLGVDCVNAIRWHSGERRVPAVQWHAILKCACRHLGDPTFPLKLTATLKLRHLGMLGYLMATADTLASAAHVLQRYESLLSSVTEAKVSVEGANVAMVWRSTGGGPMTEFTILSMSLWAHQARELTKRRDLACDVRFSFPEPADPAEHACIGATFGGRVLYEQATNLLMFPTHYLKLPCVLREKHVHETLRRSADIDLQNLLKTSM